MKKILKWILIIVGFLAGMLLVGVQLLQKYGYVSGVNWDKLGNDASTQIQHWAANVDVSNVHGLFHSLGIPVTGGYGFFTVCYQNRGERIFCHLDPTYMPLSPELSDNNNIYR